MTDYSLKFVRFDPGWTHQAGPPAVCVKAAPIAFERFARFYSEGAHGVITARGATRQHRSIRRRR
jgi:hypothetical protein